MDKYSSFETEDFILDEFFIRWVLEQNTEDDLIWSNWLKAHPEVEKHAMQAKSIVQSIRFNEVPQIPRGEIDAFILQVTPAKQVFNWKLLLGAASLILLLSFGVYVYLSSKNSHIKDLQSQAYVETNNTGKSPMFIHLQDGTSVVLKPGSRFSYPTEFKGMNREVSLHGEAFFEVHKNSEQPFLIHTDDMITKVLGTSFTIRAYQNEEDYKVVVNTGRVEVFRADDGLSVSGKTGVVLLPNEQVTYQKRIHSLQKEKLEQPALLSKEIASKSFSFKDAPVAQVFQRLKDTYGISIVYDERTFSACSITAKLYDDNVYEKLTAICKAIDASFRIENGNIMITGEGCSP